MPSRNDPTQPPSTAGTSEVHGEAEVQKKMDAETDQGFRGIKADPTPDEHYTVAGVLADKPTPENQKGADNG